MHCTLLQTLAWHNQSIYPQDWQQCHNNGMLAVMQGRQPCEQVCCQTIIQWRRVFAERYRHNVTVRLLCDSGSANVHVSWHCIVWSAPATSCFLNAHIYLALVQTCMQLSCQQGAMPVRVWHRLLVCRMSTQSVATGRQSSAQDMKRLENGSTPILIDMGTQKLEHIKGTTAPYMVPALAGEDCRLILRAQLCMLCDDEVSVCTHALQYRLR